jgi:hypothetical protein
MPLSRRQFIQIISITLASLGLAYTGKQSMLHHASLSRLRKYWIDLEEQFVYSEAGAENYTLFLQLLERTAAAYRGELDALVEAGEIHPQVASNLLAAYIEVSYHIWRSTWPATCYMSASPEFDSQFSRERLLRQAHILEELAGSNEIDPGTIRLAQAAMQKEIAFLSQVKVISKDMLGRGYGQAQGWSESSGEAEIERYASETAVILSELLAGETH